MIPTLIEDYIAKVLDKKVHLEKRQFYYSTLLNIKNAIDKTLEEYEREKRSK